MRNVGGLVLSVGLLFSTLGVTKCNEMAECPGIVACAQALPLAPRFRFEQELPSKIRVSLGDREILNECMPPDAGAGATPPVTRVDANTIELDAWGISWLPIEGTWPLKIESAPGCAEGDVSSLWTEGSYSRDYVDSMDACAYGCGTWKEQLSFSLPGAMLERGTTQPEPVQQ